MLRELHICNLAIIDELRLEFGPGLNILSGETGAGKSIVLDAVYLILGARSDSEMVRAGSETGVVEASFEIDNQEAIKSRLENHGIIFEADEPLVIKRVLSRSGKNKVYVNGQLANVTILQELTRGLVDISSQHEFHKLMDPNSHVRILDSFGGLNELRAEYQVTLKEMHALLLEAKQLSMDESERVRQMDMLEFQIKEITDLDPKHDEDQLLEKELKKLSSAKERQSFVAHASEVITESETNIMDQLSKILDTCTDLVSVDEGFEPLRRCLEVAHIQLEEASRELHSLSRATDCDEGRMEEVGERIHALKSLMRKYGKTAEEIHAFRERAQGQLKQLLERESNLKHIQDKLEALRDSAMELGMMLSQKRKRVAEDFKIGIEAELKELGLEHAQLSLSFEPMEAKRKFGPDGVDRMQFDISMNPGEPAKPLVKIASGGELSRILLAMKNVLAGRDEISVYVFDEVDTGIGGRVGLQVGQKLASVARHNQVICITHLPQVACFADVHFQVAKTVTEGRTTTLIRKLEESDRADEITRMVGGAELGATAVKHAQELLRAMRQKREESRQENQL